jgi:ABC-type Co2+ transport system permease subunit
VGRGRQLCPGTSDVDFLGDLNGIVVLGLAMLIRRTCRAALIAMLAVSLGYVAAAAILMPHLLVDPLGSIVKIVPIMLAILFVLAILDER